MKCYFFLGGLPYQGTQRQNLAWLDRFTICEVGYPAADVEKKLLAQRFPSLPETLCATMVDYANEVRKLFMGEASAGNLTNTIEVTFSTRSLLRWGDLTVHFQPLAHQGIQPITYTLDRALAYRASRETRAMLHELAQRMFPQHTEADIKAMSPDAEEEFLQGEQAPRSSSSSPQPSRQNTGWQVLDRRGPARRPYAPLGQTGHRRATTLYPR